MSLLTHGDQKYLSSTLIGDVAEWDALRVEQRHIRSGRQNCVARRCTELVFILSGQVTGTRRKVLRVRNNLAGSSRDP